MRLIDIDAIPDESYWCRDALSEAIETAPIIDAVPREKYDRLKENAEILSKACAEKEYVVRCKNCKRVDTPRCPFYRAGWGYTDDDFCSCGERGETDEWIPVSERLPDDEIGVLVTREIEGERYVECAMHFNGVWLAPTDSYKIGRHEVIAWMPLPESYRGEKRWGIS